MIAVPCPTCRKRFGVSNDQAGQTVQCLVCQEWVKAPTLVPMQTRTRWANRPDASHSRRDTAVALVVIGFALLIFAIVLMEMFSDEGGDTPRAAPAAPAEQVDGY